MHCDSACLLPAAHHMKLVYMCTKLCVQECPSNETYCKLETIQKHAHRDTDKYLGAYSANQDGCEQCHDWILLGWVKEAKQ